jgi:mannose-1-phosphate guanylyltransferase
MSEQKSVHLVVMAGGSGTRFWPKSTSRRPKQLLSFGPESQATLLAQTIDRFDGVVPKSQRWIVTTAALVPAVREAVSAEVAILGEPQARNTAPCIYWAARKIAEQDPGAILLVMPADHFIPRVAAFQETLQGAIERAARYDELVTLGVKPDRPETGYGYLKVGPALGGGCSKVEAFVEKPSLEKARGFLADGHYLWNGGMFVWRAEVILAAFDRWMPEMKQAWETSGGDIEKAYPRMTATSIDYGILERHAQVVTFPLDCGWDDLGSWTSLENLAEVLGARVESNVVSAGKLVSVDARGNVIDVPGKLVALLGVEDLIVVEHGGALLVARKERAQDIRQVVDAVKKAAPELA